MALDSLIDSRRDPKLTESQKDILVGEGTSWGHIREELLSREESDPDELERTLFAHLQRLVDKLRSISSTEIRAPASVAIKLLVSDGAHGSAVIRSLLRDRLSYEHRKHAPDDFPWLSNSAFSDIVTGKEKDGYFVSGDLEALESRGKYRNVNPGWKLDYNSTAVMAIPIKSNAASGIVGFICVDSPWGDLTALRVKHALAITSRHLYNILGVLVAGRDRQVYKDLVESGAKDFRIGWRYATRASQRRLTVIDAERQAALEEIVRRQHQYWSNPGVAREAAAGLVIEPPSADGGSRMAQDTQWFRGPSLLPEEKATESEVDRFSMTAEEFEAFVQEEARSNPTLARALEIRGK